MNTKLQWIYNNAPILLQNIMVTFYNLKQNKGRYGGDYKSSKKYFKKWQYKSYEEIKKEQERRLTKFLLFTRSNSSYYQEIIPKQTSYSLKDLPKIPIMTKSELVEEYEQRKTMSEKDGYVSYTGGTTGASLKVVYKWEDIQERRAFLDFFWEQYGYKKGANTAWFSGKHIVPNNNSNVFWRKDWINNIRYYSTFHITRKNIGYYINNLNQFSPQFIVGFPSSVHQIVKLAKDQGLKFEGSVRCFFPTAEKLNSEEVAEIKEFFKCELRDQYASSEGAPFITECPKGKLHYDMLTGIIEVVDTELMPSQEGEILVTSFTTRGTPLVRYKIGDQVSFDQSGRACSCGQKTPVIEKIHGRSNDYILSPDHGKINLGNLSNCTKGIKGIIQFQIIQENRKEIIVKIKPGEKFSELQARAFKRCLQTVIGPSMTINIKNVTDIPQEKSGKFRMVKNKLIK
ncbi:hypothetical protein KUV50_00570 [Membranicola marinus]|uniref:Phenylacetate-CoA ligase n=1 Tax=Membranihabitans marinus TaxID=1227546 RepID=A0A953L9F7_9BACT|nr:hypothetical protein [Membranihabitans marinus]MBY5956606.1 hypothetical protein [Membranihabitans marinus]